MALKDNYNQTLNASYLGYVVQAVVNNFAPLLFLTFQKSYGISLARIAMMVTVNFGIQLAVDLLSARFVDRIGYRTCIVAAHVFAALGLAGLSFLPDMIPGHFGGLLVCVALYAVGGRHHRGTDQPHCGSLSNGPQRCGHEPAALFLLLGVRGRGGTVHCLFSDSRSEQLAGIGPSLGSSPCYERCPVFAGSHSGTDRGWAGDGDSGTVKKQPVLAFYFYYGLRRGIGTGYEPVGLRFC